MNNVDLNMAHFKSLLGRMYKNLAKSYADGNSTSDIELHDELKEFIQLVRNNEANGFDSLRMCHTETTTMKTFVAEDVLRDYTAGMVVVKAESFEKAVGLINDSDWFDGDCHGEVLTNLRELKDSEVVVVKGGM